MFSNFTTEHLTDDEIAILKGAGYELHGVNSEGIVYFIQGDTEIGRSRTAWRKLIATLTTSKAAAHTPGPWVECAESGDWWIQNVVENNPEAEVIICGTNDMDAADVALICAAPDLLAACQCVMDEQSIGMYGAISNECIAQIRAAIDKALKA